jgi:SAM-dependent methyltransferase
MANRESWASTAAALPQGERRQRELPFWQALVDAWGWRRVLDAGCGAGFHIALLRDLGVAVAGFDRSLAALLTAPRGLVVAGDLLLPPLQGAAADGVICLGNTISLLPSRRAQRQVLAALAGLLRPGGVVLLQGEDTRRLVAAGPLLRTRRIDPETVHVRVFERAGRQIRLLAGVARVGGEIQLEESCLLPTSAADLGRLAPARKLRRIEPPAAPPGAGATWWVALETSTGSGLRAPGTPLDRPISPP